MRNIAVLIFLLFGCSAGLFAQTVTLSIKDQHSKEPVIGAHVLDAGGRVFEVSDAEGMIRISETYTVFAVQAVGYLSRVVNLKEQTGTVYLIPQIIQSGQQVLVYAYGEDRENIREYQNSGTHHTLDRFMNNIDGLAMIQRGAFAREPSIRGQSDQRMNLTIDGMQIFKACVDKMDPITSYIESNNLSTLNVDKGGTGVAEHGNGNSSINLITKKPEFSEFTLHAESGYRYPDAYRVASVSSNYAAKNTAVYAAGSIRKADDYVAGNGLTVQNSQFNKMNLNAGIKQRLKGNDILELNYITDKATDVGYPSLLMDATKALAHILRLEYVRTGQTSPYNLRSAMIYGNTISHRMDDYNRDVTRREVMKNMYMPMYGSTKTAGAKFDGGAAIADHAFDWYLTGFFSRADGDMLMESLDPNIADMYIYNMDNIRTTSVHLGARHSVFIGSRLLLKLEESISFTSLGTKSENYRSLFEGLYGKTYKTAEKALFSGSASAVWLLTDTRSLDFSAVYSARMGNHIEMLGHYIYNYTDGYFYDGNPWLKPEKTLHIEAGFTEERDNFSLSLTVFNKLYYDYIAGEESTVSGDINFRFKQYQNMGRALLAGGEFRTILTPADKIKADLRASYTFAQNLTLNDPLPLIPPVKGAGTVSWNTRAGLISGGVEWALAQNRISRKASTEEKTNAYAVFNAGYTLPLFSRAVEAVFEAENILDTRYREHTSVGGIPEAGRRFMLTLKYHL